MALTDTSLIVLLATLALGLFGLVTIGLPRWKSPFWRGVGRGVQVLVLNVLVVALFGAALNNQYLFYSSWGDLLGARSPAVQVHAGGSSPDLVASKVHGPGFAAMTTSVSLPPLPAPNSRLQTYTVVDKRSNSAGQVLVYLPVGYDPKSPRTYPVLLGLHGFPAGPESFLRIPFMSSIDTLTARHQLAASIVVVPRIDTPATIDTECVNGGSGQPQTDTWLSHDVPAWMAQHFRVKLTRTAWAAIGYSYGAWCAASITMRHPDVFGAAIVMLGYFRPDFSRGYDPLTSSTLRGYDLVNLARRAPPPIAMWILTSREDSLSYPTTSAFLSVARPPSTSPGWSWPRVAIATRCSSHTSLPPCTGWVRRCPGSVADHGGSVRHRAYGVVTFLGLAGLVVTLAVLAPSAHRVLVAGPDGTVGGAPGTTTSSTSTAPGSRTLVALGDSVPSADTCGCTGYVEQVGERLGVLTHRSWVVHNDATDGWTTSDVESDLSAAATRAHLADADLVLIEVGANDFDLSRVDDPGCVPAASSGCWTSTIEGLRSGLTRIIHGIRQIDVRPDLRVVLVGYWDVTVDGEVGRAFGSQFVIGSDQLTRLVNSTVQQVATRTGAEYVDAYTPLKGELGTRDPTSDLLQMGTIRTRAGTPSWPLPWSRS